MMSSDELLTAELDRFGKGDIDAMVEAHAPDASFITPMGIMRGRDQIRGMIEAVLDEFAKPGMRFEIVHKSASGPAALLVWKGETADNVYEFAVETYVFAADGKIAQHTFAAKAVPKHQ
ncbi:MAG: nuclear transport factor 2 family protein [Bauldia sp.]